MIVNAIAPEASLVALAMVILVFVVMVFVIMLCGEKQQQQQQQQQGQQQQQQSQQQQSQQHQQQLLHQQSQQQQQQSQQSSMVAVSSSTAIVNDPSRKVTGANNTFGVASNSNTSNGNGGGGSGAAMSVCASNKWTVPEIAPCRKLSPMSKSFSLRIIYYPSVCLDRIRPCFCPLLAFPFPFFFFFFFQAHLGFLLRAAGGYQTVVDTSSA
jgi:type II secretory pathway pseudopilin PulG